MRVGIIGSRGFPVVYSGYETLVTHLAPGLAARGMEVTVYCHRHLFASRLQEVDGVRLVYVPGLRGKTTSQYSHSSLAVVHAAFTRFDVALVLNVANGFFVPPLEAVGTRTIVNVDGVEWERPKWKGVASSVFRAAARAATRSASVIVTDAEAMRLRYLQEFNRDSVVIAYGADVPDLVELENPQALAPWGLKRGEYLLILGRLIPDNNGELLVRAYMESRVAKKLVVVGDVPYADRYASSLRALAGDRVIFTGYLTDQTLLRQLIAGACLYLHGHEFGGTNPSLLLAMSTGVPIAALDTPFSREVLPDVPGMVFFAKRMGEAVDAIRRATESPHRGPLSALRERIRERYQWSTIVEAYAGLIGELVRPGPRGRRRRLRPPTERIG